MNRVKILSIEKATHDVVKIKTEKPDAVAYLPGQAVDVAIDTPEMENELRAFTFTSLPDDEFLEFYIKIYPEHHGVTEKISKLKENEYILIGGSFGDIQYKGEGIFLAGGAGITPFIAILKDLKSQNNLGNNKLIFANKTAKDIIEKDYFESILGENFINVLSAEEKIGMEHGYITKEIIKNQMDDTGSYFYLCGPPPMMDAVTKSLIELGIAKDKIVKEQF